MSNILSLSPLDGRYHEKVKELSEYFSEMALMKFRLMIEVEYFIALSLEKKIVEIKPLTITQQKQLRKIYENFSLSDAEEIKKTEKITNHDVKAIEYFFKNKLIKTPLEKYAEYIHFALTSEDINNLSYTLMLKNGVEKVVLPEIKKLLSIIKQLSKKYKDISLLSLTHGQPATPTTIGKELAVFASRLEKQLHYLLQAPYEGKLNGATGNYAAAAIAYPEVPWIDFSKKLIKSLKLTPNLLTTQIENHDASAYIYDCLARINSIIKDLNQDMWLYISRGIFKLKKKEGEVGSSTMPHKVNPINFENSEGNIGLANSMLRFFSDKLMVSRMQRDLTDSTVIRNQGIALGYSLLAYKNTLTGLEKIEINKESITQELEEHWEVLAEAIQTVLRKTGYEKPYEKLKELTRGEKIDKKTIKDFIQKLDIPKKEKETLLQLTPQIYVGLSKKLVDLI